MSVLKLLANLRKKRYIWYSMSPVSDTYLSIEAESEGLYKDRGSRFLAFAFPAESEDEVKARLEQLRREYHDARHHCCAYRLGKDGSLWRASDDGEPAGSAGRPILGQIDSAGLSDVAVVVVRYFGGIKLGVPGLIAAYKGAAADALGKALKVEKVAGKWWRVGFGYDRMPTVMKAFKDLGLKQRTLETAQECSAEVRVRDTLREAFLERMKGCTLEELQ